MAQDRRAWTAPQGLTSGPRLCNTFVYYEHVMPLTVRLNPKTERLLNALAKQRKQTRSDVVREAIEQFGAAEKAETTTGSVYDEWADVIGIGRTTGRDFSKTTGEQFTEAVLKKARARRPR
jgi:predicted transcriptional regulator